MHCHRSDPKKRLLLPLCLALAAVALDTQPPREPLESPKAIVSQVVGLEPIVVTYHSPGVKDRTIWGELVPWGQNWRAGANDKTTVQFSEKVKIGDAEIEAGTYGLYIFPHDATRWELVLNSDPEGSPNTFDKAKDVLRLTVKPAAGRVPGAAAVVHRALHRLAALHGRDRAALGEAARRDAGRDLERLEGALGAALGRVRDRRAIRQEPVVELP